MRKRSLGADFDRLWHAYTESTLGSAAGNGALPLVAVLVLHASTLRVALLAAGSGIAGAVILFPLGARCRSRVNPAVCAQPPPAARTSGHEGRPQVPE